jgi:hypothetical protein
MDAHVAICALADRAKHGGGTSASPARTSCLGVIVVGKDIVDFVATATQPPNIWPLAISTLRVRLAYGLLLIELLGILLGKTEVNERTMP